MAEAKVDSYGVDQIDEMNHIDHVRHNTSMYIGSTQDTTPLLFEAFDNAVDEALAGFATIIGVFIDTNTGIVKILDNGRGMPFDVNLPLDDDPPVMTTTRLFTSGKFKKGKKTSAYKISSGLHGIGNVAIYALSEWMNIEIYKNNIHAIYSFTETDTKRTHEPYEGQRPFSTKVEFKPNKKYFESLSVNLKSVEERIRIVVAEYPAMQMIFRVDGKDNIINGSEADLIKSLLSKTVTHWHEFENKNKDDESYKIAIGWEDKFGPVKTLTSVNLVRVHEGVHVNKILNILREQFQTFAKKHKFTFNKDDILQGCRIYINLKIIETAFAAQVKTKLETASDISIMDTLEVQIKKYFAENTDGLIELLTRFQAYRTAIQSKKLTNKSTLKRSTTKFTKLRDCGPGGELIIGEGDSAVSGLIPFRDPEKHAILPLRGVIPNALTMEKTKLLNNAEVKDIIQALGTGIYDQCDVTKLRYDKIIIATDADPAGHWIASLLIILFAVVSPSVIQQGRVYICRTPLYGVYRRKQFVPLWDDNELADARDKNEEIFRFKGLGEFAPKQLQVFTLQPSTRQLIQVQWSEHYEKLFKLFKESTAKRQLVEGTWSLT